TVAVKVLRQDHQIPGARRRFLNEARLLSKLKHPNIVSVVNFGALDDDRNYLVMEFLDGPTLGSVLKSKGRIEPLRAGWITLQMVRGMQTVHARGIVHRDLKPENIFLLNHDGDENFVKIIDFGIAKINGPDGGKKSSSSKPGSNRDRASSQGQ